MKFKRIAAVTAAVVAGALALSGCSAPYKSEVISGTSITVAWNDSYYAFNDGLIDTNAASNEVVNYLAKDGFFYYDNNSNLVADTAFGTVTKVSDDPLTVKYKVNKGVVWSDGTQVDAADLLLGWAANTTHETSSDAAATTDDDGNLTGQTGTYWNTGAAENIGLDLAQDVPTIGDDGLSVTLTYSSFYVDWNLVGLISPVSAHGTVELAYPDKYDATADGAKAAKADLITAIQNKDLSWLAPVSVAYNQDYKFTDTPTKPQQLWGTGYYNITEVNSTGQYVTLTANPLHTWGPSTHYEKVTIRSIPDMQDQLTALQNGEISIASGQPTADIASQLAAGITGVDYSGSPEGTYEHVDLQATNSGPFDAATYGGGTAGEAKAKAVRQAFLLTIPRQQILDKLIKPLQSDAVLRNSQIFIPGTDGATAAAAVNGYADMTGSADNLAQAKKILSDAGITTPVKVRLLFSKTNKRRQAEFALLQANAAGLFNVTDASSTTWGSDLQTKPNAYDAALFGWQSTSTAVGESSANYITGGTNNYYGWSNSDVDSTFDQLQSASDPTTQQDLQVQAEKLVGEQYWSIPIFQFPGITAWSNSVTGVVPGFLAPTYFWNFWEWKPAS